jgi:hypothetical protein
MKSSFGNYVIQKALKIAVNENKAKLVEAILNHVEKLCEKKLINKWKKLVEESVNKNNIIIASENKKKSKKIKKSSVRVGNVNINFNINNNNDNYDSVYNTNQNLKSNRNNFLSLNSF